jgi:beta-phosphoglucomutase
LNQIRAIIFDLDGVLADLVDVHYQALNDALAKNGFPTIGREAQATLYNGLPTKTKLKLLGVTEPADIQRVYDDKQIATMAYIRQVCHVDIRLIALLQQLRDRGYRLVVASNAILDTIKAALDGLGVTQFFEFVLSNQDVANPKPHPEIYLAACDRLQLKPWETLVVEDSPHGVRACLEAGCRLCLVKNPEDVSLPRIMESVIEHENLGYLLPPPEPRNKPLR